jgi:hypothetical protein
VRGGRPAGHATKHQLGVAGQTLIGSHTESFHHPGSKTFDDCIGAFDEREQCFDALGMFQVERNVATSAQHHIPMTTGHVVPDGLHAINPHHFGSHVGEHHRGERARSDTGNFQDSNTAERTCHVLTSSA